MALWKKYRAKHYIQKLWKDRLFAVYCNRSSLTWTRVMEALDKGNTFYGMKSQDKINQGKYFVSLVSYVLKFVRNLENNGICNVEKKSLIILWKCRSDSKKGLLLSQGIWIICFLTHLAFVCFTLQKCWKELSILLCFAFTQAKYSRETKTNCQNYIR